MTITEASVTSSNEEEHSPVHKIHQERRKTHPVEKTLKITGLQLKWSLKEDFLGCSCAGTDGHKTYLVTGVRAVGRTLAVLKGKHRQAIFLQTR